MIVAAAAEEFATQGIDGTTTAAICQRAGIGSGTFFHYFPTKQAAFLAVFADDVPRVEDLCARALATADADVGLDLLLDHLLAEVADPLAPGLASAAVLQANRDPELARVLVSLDDRLARALTTILQRVRRRSGRQLAFSAPATARWIQRLVDATHLGTGAVPRATEVAELRRIIAWLIGRG